jgi:hypothetical protein
MAPVDAAKAARTNVAKAQRMIVSPNRDRGESVDAVRGYRNDQRSYQARRSIAAMALGAGGANSRRSFSADSVVEFIVSSR